MDGLLRPNSIMAVCMDPLGVIEILRDYFKAKVSTGWIHEPTGL